MKKLQSYSFHLHWVTMCCFMLPFFYDSCSTKKHSDIADDSVKVVVPVDDTLNVKDSISEKHIAPDTAVSAILTPDTTAESTTNDKDDLLSEKIIKKYPISQLILTPANGTQTGLYIVLNTIPFTALFAAALSFILLLIGLLSKLIDKNALKIFLLLEICAILSLYISVPHLLFAYEIIWGYWVCISFMLALILIDGIIIYKQKNNTRIKI